MHGFLKIAIEFFKYRAGALSPAKMGGWQSTRPMKGQQSLISGGSLSIAIPGLPAQLKGESHKASAASDREII